MEENKSLYKYYLIPILVFTVLVYLYHANDSLDLTRYYESANSYSSFSAIGVIKDSFNFGIDFVYYLTLWCCNKFGLPYDILTIAYVSAFYIFLYKIVNVLYDWRCLSLPILCFCVMCAPFVWDVSISRNMAANTFLIVGLYYLVKEKYYKCILFSTIAILTHISVILYVVVFTVSFVISKLDINLKPRWIRLLIVIIPIFSSAVFSYYKDFILIFSDSVSTITERYAAYADNEAAGFTAISSIGIGDKAPVIFIWLLSLFLLWFDKNRNVFFWAFLLLFVLLSGFILTSWTMTNRIIMLMPVCIANSMCSLYQDNVINKKLLNLIALLGFAIWFGSIYTYREWFYIGSFE